MADPLDQSVKEEEHIFICQGLSGVPFHDPFNLRRGNKTPFAQWSSHDVEIVHLEPIGCAAGVVAARNADDVAIGDSHCFIQLQVISVNALDAKASRRVQAVVICLFQIGYPGVVVLVMAMAGIT